jgi:hypothetical protein
LFLPPGVFTVGAKEVGAVPCDARLFPIIFVPLAANRLAKEVRVWIGVAPIGRVVIPAPWVAADGCSIEDVLDVVVGFEVGVRGARADFGGHAGVDAIGAAAVLAASLGVLVVLGTVLGRLRGFTLPPPPT